MPSPKKLDNKEPVHSASAPIDIRRRDQSGPASQRPSGSSRKVILIRPLVPSTDHSQEDSSIGLVDADLATAPKERRQHGPGTRLAGPQLMRPVVDREVGHLQSPHNEPSALQLALLSSARIEDCSQATPRSSDRSQPVRALTGSEADYPQILRNDPSTLQPDLPATTRKQERSQATSRYLAAARLHSPSLASVSREDSPEAPRGGSPAARPQVVRQPSPSRGEPRQAPQGGVSAARPQASRQAALARENSPQAPPGDSVIARTHSGPSAIPWSPFHQSNSQVFRHVSERQATIRLPTGTLHLPTHGKNIIARGRGNQQPLGSQTPRVGSARLPGRPGTGRGTGGGSSSSSGGSSSSSGGSSSSSGGGSSSSGGSTQDNSIDATGQQFFPPAVGNQVLLPGYDVSISRAARSPNSKMGIGIETEFLLKAKAPEGRRSKFDQFTEVVTGGYNFSVQDRHPRMVNDVLNFGKRNRLDTWGLTTDSSMSTFKEPWGVEMITPLFVAFPDSGWRGHVRATWNYLQQHYEITDNKDCGTHVHVSVEGGYTLEELKRIASAVLHFEPAFEALVPEHRREDCEYARSSWIDSREFAPKGLSRAQSILVISDVADFHLFLGLMHPYSQRGYAWNFRSIGKYYTIEFRKPPASKTASEALGWAEFAMSFVQTSIRHGSPELLKLVPPTVGGLRWFLGQNHNVPGFNESEKLAWIWDGKDPNEFLEGKPFANAETAAQMATTKRMMAADKRHILRLIATKREPYWQD